VFHHGDPLAGHVITVQVMAVTDVSAPHKDAVCTFLEGLQDMVR
jgi:hypothetical protein